MGDVAIRGLSLTQPWASLMALGAKRVETRSWATNYRGRVAIHAAAGFPGWARETCLEEPFRSALRLEHPAIGLIPRGVILAVGTLVDCRPTESFTDISETEREFGDYGPDRFGWIFKDVERLAVPLPYKGSLGLWRLSEDALVAIEMGARLYA